MAIGTTAALIGGAAIGAGGSYLASENAADASASAASAQERAAMMQTALQERIFNETAPQRAVDYEGSRFNLDRAKGFDTMLFPLRQEGIKNQLAQTQLSGSMLPFLRQDIGAQPGTSPLFQRTLEQQTRNIQSNLSPFGLSDSSVAGRAIGEGTAALTAQDLENMRNRRSSFFSLGIQGVNPPQQMSSGFGVQQAPQQGSVPFGNISKYAADSQGQFGQNLGGMMGNFGGQLAQRGFSNLFGGGTGQTVGQGFNAFSAPPTQALTSPAISGFLNM